MEIWPGTAYPLGATYDGTGTNFALFSEVAERVELCLVDDDGVETRVDLPEVDGFVWHGYIPAVQPGQRYGYRVHGPYDPENGHRCDPSKLLLDPYAKAVEGQLTNDQALFSYDFSDPTERNTEDSLGKTMLGVVINPYFDWGHDRPPRHEYHDTVIYEAHVKGLTMTHPDIPEEIRGTYAAIAHPAVIEHLTTLGVTAIELMPVHQFVQDTSLQAKGLTNYWGYNTIGFLAPHNAYARSDRGEQVTEFKAMVKALHEANIEVILDVVYNHTAEGNEKGRTLSMRGLDNSIYYIVDPKTGAYANYSGCGNTVNCNHPVVRDLIIDALCYWVTEMHVDGFRFDLAAALARSMHDVDMLGTFVAVIQQDPVLREVKLIAEPWDIGPGGYQVGGFPHLWTEWNDRFRDTVRDFWRGHADGVRDLAQRVSGSSDLYAADGRRPFASINFVTAHDGFTLRDLVSYGERHNEANLADDGHPDNRSANYGAEGPTDDPDVLAVRRRQMANLLTTLLLSTGVPMLTAGDEIGRTQQGNNNAYCQDNEISWLDWESAAAWADLTSLVRRLLRLRAEHPVFRQRHFFVGQPAVEGGRKDVAWFSDAGEEMSDAQWWDPQRRTLGLFLAGDAIRSRNPDGSRVTDASFLLWLHADREPVPVRLPDAGSWAESYEVLVDTGRPSREGRRIRAGETVEMPGRSCLLLRADEPGWAAG